MNKCEGSVKCLERNANYVNWYDEIVKAIQNGDVKRMQEIYGLNLGVFNSRISDLVHYWKEGDLENNAKTKEMFDVMLKKGLKINDQENRGRRTALLLALEERKPTLVKFFLEEGADPNLLYKIGSTALHTAVKNRDFVSYKNLLLAGADPTISDNLERIPDSYAVEGDRPILDEIRKEIKTLVGVKILAEHYPVYNQNNNDKTKIMYNLYDVETIKNLKDYLGGKTKRRNTKRRTTKRRNTKRRK